MSAEIRDPNSPAGEAGTQTDPPRTDSELSLSAILLFTVAIALIIGAAIGGMYLFSTSLADRQAANDPPIPVLPEARQQIEPPEPRLQSDPIRELAEFHAAEEAELSAWGWTDEAAGIARVPVETAMGVLVEHGFDAGRDSSSSPATDPESPNPEVTAEDSQPETTSPAR